MSQWEYIKRCIAQADYFAIIAAHRYGSRIPDGTGRSFTEAEYDLALELKKPILRFVLRDSAAWPGDAIHRESDLAGQKAITSFRNRLLETNMSGLWSTADSLSTEYATALSQTIQNNPVGGLYPVDGYPDLVKLGIRTITRYSNTVNHADILSEEGTVTIVLNDGYHFIDRYGGMIASRARRGLETRVLLVHPASRNLELIALKSDKELAEQQRDILESARRLSEIRSQASSQAMIQCYGHQYINTYNMCIGPTRAHVSMYFNRMRWAELTTLVLDAKRDGLYAAYAEDVDRLWRETKAVSGADLLAPSS